MSIGRKRCGPNQSCAMIRFRHVVFYWFLSISGSLFFFSLRGQDCRQSSLWVMCHHSICRGRGGGGGYVRKVGRTAPPSGWIDPLLSSLTISRYPPVTDRTEYIYIYRTGWYWGRNERKMNLYPPLVLFPPTAVAGGRGFLGDHRQTDDDDDRVFTL